MANYDVVCDYVYERVFVSTIDGVAVWYLEWKLVISIAILFEIADIRDWINAMWDACRFYMMKWKKKALVMNIWT